MSNIIMHISPFPIVSNFKSQETTGDADSAPFIGIAYCSSQSSFYGIFAFFVTNRSGFLVLAYSNVVGVTMGVYYVFTFLRNCRNEEIQRLTAMYLKGAAFLVTMQAACIMTLAPTRALFVVGLTSSLCALLSAASLVTAVPDAIKSRCSKNLPVPVLIPAAFSAFLWFLCGIDLLDPYIALPNGIYVLICLFALSLSFYFPSEPAEECCEKSKLANFDAEEEVDLKAALKKGAGEGASFQADDSTPRLKGHGQTYGSTGGSDD